MINYYYYWDTSRLSVHHSTSNVVFVFFQNAKKYGTSNIGTDLILSYLYIFPLIYYNNICIMSVLLRPIDSQ